MCKLNLIFIYLLNLRYMVYVCKESMDSENEKFFLAASSPTCHMLEAIAKAVKFRRKVNGLWMQRNH